MADKNYVPIVITPAQMVENATFIKNLSLNLPETLINLTPGQRKSFLKMGDKTVAFCTKIVEIAIATPVLVPAFVNVDELQLNLQSVTDLLVLLRSLEVITSKLDDSSLLAGKETYMDCLSIYNNIKNGAERNVSGAKVAYEDLKKRFPGRKSKVPVDPPTA